MKLKSLFAFSFLMMLLVHSAHAQRPYFGNPFSLEGNLSLGTPTFSSPTLRLRYFAKESLALRLGLTYSSTSTTEYFYGVDDNGNISESRRGELKSSVSSFVSSLGASYHLSETDYLSPYLAFDLLFGSQTNKTLGKQTLGGDYLENSSSKSRIGSFVFGLRLAAGVDYYFVENLFIGLELGFSYLNTQEGKGEISESFAGQTVSSTVLPEKVQSGFNNYSTGAVRVGWRF